MMLYNKNLVVKTTENGKGVFSKKKFRSGENIIQFRGNLFSYDELPTPYNQKTKDYYVQIGKDLYMGPSNGIDDFFNHSCSSNAGLKIDNYKVFLVALKRINEGDEVTWDYSTTMDEDDWEIDCNCGNKNCRKRIRDFKYLPKTIQRRYLNLGIVPSYIEKKYRDGSK